MEPLASAAFGREGRGFCCGCAMRWKEYFSPAKGLSLIHIFLGGAEHAFAGHAAQLALLDLHAAGQPGAHLGHGHQDARLAVGRAANDLQGLALANVHGGYAQMVAVGMGDAGEHPAHHHVLHLGTQVFIALHAVAAHNHAVHVRLGLQGNGGIGPDPLHGNLQCQTPPCGSYGCILG